VKNDGSGNLKGYAWSENVGWINFSCHTVYTTCPAPVGTWGVSINSATGVFSGHAWGENIGWITFSCPGCGFALTTGWRAAAVGVGGIAEQPDVTELPSATASGRDYTPYIIGVVIASVVVVVGAAGWRTRPA
jgi:hypothetical protein